jgi:hypothetical protein
LRFAGRELTLHINGLQVVGVTGDDGERLAPAFGLFDGGEWFAEADKAVRSGQLSKAEAVAVVKRVLSECLRDFFLDPAATVQLERALPSEPQGLNLSYPHIVVDLVLGPGGEDLVSVLLPDPTVTLRRLPEFLKRVGALGLTEEGMAILAKVDDRRSAEEIARPSPHGRDTVLRLLAAAVGAGIVEPMQPLAEVPMEQAQSEPAPPRRRRVWPWVALLLVGAAAAYLAVMQPWRQLSGVGGPWSVAVDSGCQPAEVERLYRRQEKDAANLRVTPFGRSGEQCFRLVWGHFPSREAAELAMRSLPQGVLARGFVPHVVHAEDAPVGQTGR